MCVRVIMGVVNCRLDYKLFVLWYCSVPNLTIQAVCAGKSSFCVTRQCIINWITWYSVNFTEILCFIFVFYNDNIPQEFKLYWITKDVTLSCLSLLSWRLCLLKFGQLYTCNKLAVTSVMNWCSGPGCVCPSL